MKASWVAACSVGLLVTSLTPSPAAAGLVGDAFLEALARADLRSVAGPSESQAPLFVLSSFELGESENAVTGLRTTPLSSSWSPVVRHATEPSSLLLMGTGLLGIATLLRRRRRAAR